MTGLLNPESSEIGHFICMILVVYLGSPWDFSSDDSCFFGEVLTPSLLKPLFGGQFYLKLVYIGRDLGALTEGLSSLKLRNLSEKKRWGAPLT